MKTIEIVTLSAAARVLAGQGKISRRGYTNLSEIKSLLFANQQRKYRGN